MRRRTVIPSDKDLYPKFARGSWKSDGLTPPGWDNSYRAESQMAEDMARRRYQMEEEQLHQKLSAFVDSYMKEKTPNLEAKDMYNHNFLNLLLQDVNHMREQMSELTAPNDRELKKVKNQVFLLKQEVKRLTQNPEELLKRCIENFSLTGDKDEQRSNNRSEDGYNTGTDEGVGRAIESWGG